MEYVHTFVFDTKIFYNLRTFDFQIMYVSIYVEYVNREYVLQCTLKTIPRMYLEILKQPTQQRHFVCNFSLPSIVETRSFYCLSKKILLLHLDKNSCEHVNRTKIFDHRVLACLQFRTYIFCLVVILYIYGFMMS